MSVNRDNLQLWVVDALKSHGGRGTIVQVCKHIWEHHEGQLRTSGDLFFTWQYDVRWAANILRRNNIMRPAEDSPQGIWELA